MDTGLNAFFEDVFLPIAIVFIIFGLPILAFVFFRVLAHRERMAMISAGVPVGSVPPSGVPGAGTVPPPGAPTATSGAMPKSHAADHYVSEPAQVTLNKGIRLGMIGFAITLGLSIASIRSGDGDLSWHPGPWLLIGLVPMFIGIAQIIIAVLSGANVGRFSQTPQTHTVPSEPYVAPTPPPTPARSWSPDPYDIPFPVHPPAVPDFREKDGP